MSPRKSMSNWIRSTWFQAGAAAALLLAAAAPVNAQIPVGSEFQANTYTQGNQYFPSVATDSLGAYVVVWESQDQDGSSTGIFGRRYASSGVPPAVEFPVNTYTNSFQRVTSVGMAGDGRFVAVWFGQTGSGRGISGQRYDSLGAPQGPEFQVDVFTDTNNRQVSVAVGDSGDFVVVWTSSFGDVFGRRYASSGVPLAVEFPVNTTAGASSPAVAVDRMGGDFVVVWTGQDGSESGVFGRHFDVSGGPSGPEFPVNTTTISRQREPAVAMQPGGAFVVTWSSAVGVPRGGIYAQRYASDDTKLGSEFFVSTLATGSVFDAAVAADGAGRFMIVWTSSLPSPNKGDVFGRAFASGGAPLGPEFQVNTFTTDYQFEPAISASAFGLFTVVWASFKQDPLGIASGVFGQRFSIPDGDSFTGPTVPDPNCNLLGGGNATASFTGGGAGCMFSRAEFIPASGGPTSPPVPAPVCLPYGLLDFATTGCTPGSQLDFTITYPHALGFGYWKYGHPSDPNMPPEWYQLQSAAFTGNTVTFSITDGLEGDDDLIANGNIVDPGGPGVSSAVSLSARLGPWACLLLLLLAGARHLAGRLRARG